MAYEYKLVSFNPVMKMKVGYDWSFGEQKLNELISEGWEVESSGVSSHGIVFVGSGSVGTQITFVLRRQKD